MENSDVFDSSTAAVRDFLDRMRHPSAAEFVKAIRSFIVTFLDNAPDAKRDSAAVQQFLGNMEAAFRAHSLWAGSSDEELDIAGEGLEKYLMTKLFTRVFASISEDVKADQQLHEKMGLIQQFIRPENLDIKPTYQNETSWLLAQKELQKINMHKAPRDKLACILSCCKVINNLLLNASIASKEDNPGADEFLPVLIYVTIKANPPELHSNLSYIQRYRRETRLVSESAYYFTNMLSVESFIANIDAKALSMDDTEFERNMDSAKALLAGLFESSDYPESQTSQNTEHFPNKPHVEPKPRNEELLYEKDHFPLDNKIPSISDLENKGASEVLKQEEEQVNQLFRDFPYLYSRAQNLTVGDVENLLSNYKQLVLKYVCLGKGLGVKTSLPSLPNTKTESLAQPIIVENSKPNNDMQKDTSTVEGIKTGKLEQPEIVENSEPKGDMQKDTSTVITAKTGKLELPEIVENSESNDDMQKDISTGMDTKTEKLEQPEIVENSEPNDDIQKDISTGMDTKTGKLKLPEIVENSKPNDMQKDISTGMDTKTEKLEQPEIVENSEPNDDMQKGTSKVVEDGSFFGSDNGKLKVEEVSVQNQVNEGDEKSRS